MLRLFLAMLLFPLCASAADLRISLAQDISLGTWGGSAAAMSGNSNACVYHDASANYAIRATMAAGTYRISSGGNHVAIEVAFKDSSGTGGTYTSLPYNTTRTFSSADQSSSTCSGGYNANLRVTVSEAELGQAAPGSYSGTLIVTLTAS